MKTLQSALDKMSNKTLENEMESNPYSTVNSRKKFWNSKRRYLIS
jgi:hypothetical protein